MAQPIQSTWRFSVPLLAILCAGVAYGDNWGRYDWSGFDNNLDRLLNQHLQKYQKSSVDDLLKQLQTKFNLPFDLNALKLDPKQQLKMVEAIVKGSVNSGAITNQDAGKLLDQLNDIKKKLEENQGKLDDLPSVTPKKAPPLTNDKFEPPDNANQQIDEDFARWAKEQLEWARGTEFGEKLLDSPTFKEAVRDFQRHLLQGGGKDEWRWQKWMENVRMPKWDVTMPDKLWDRLPEWQPPKLPQMNVNLPRLPRFQGRLPSFSAPRMPAPSVSALGETVLWIVVFAGCGFIVWQLIKRSALLKPAADTSLGPWPVNPRDVRTAAELIAAFEYLSVLRCGSAARAWNHIAIADGFAKQDAAQRQAAGDLAGLYAQARYAPPADPLAPHAVETARRHLCTLAGATR